MRPPAARSRPRPRRRRRQRGPAGPRPPPPGAQLRDRHPRHRAAPPLRGREPRCARCLRVGAETAATLLIAAGDNPHRMRNEASSASLYGTNPRRSVLRPQRPPPAQPRRQQASQQRPVAHRHGPPRVEHRTIDYAARRSTQGKTRREILRCIKRHIRDVDRAGIGTPSATIVSATVCADLVSVCPPQAANWIGCLPASRRNLAVPGAKEIGIYDQAMSEAAHRPVAMRAAVPARCTRIRHGGPDRSALPK